MVKHLFDRFVMWRDRRRKKRTAKSLYKKLWKANDILLYARHATFNGDKYAKYFKLLEQCSGEIEQAIVTVKKDT